MKLKKFLAAVTAVVLAVFVIAATASAAAGDNSSDSTPTTRLYVTIWYENKVNHESGAESAEIIDGEFAVEFSAQGNDGYYANLYTLGDEYLCSVIIEDGKAVFSNDGRGMYKLVIDKVSHGDDVSDVSSAKGIYAKTETASSVSYAVIDALTDFIGAVVSVIRRHFVK